MTQHAKMRKLKMTSGLSREISFVAITSPLAVTTVVGFFRYPYGFQFGIVKVFPADHVHTGSGIYHELTFHNKTAKSTPQQVNRMLPFF